MMLREGMKVCVVNDHVVCSDGSTVWVNSADRCVARFGRRGHEIQPDMYEFTAHAEVTFSEWRSFVVKVHKHFSVFVSNSHLPDYLTEC